MTEDDCLDFIDNVLSRHETWGGFESMQVVSIIYKVNILIFNESGDIYFPLGFEPGYEKTVMIAYRYATGSKTVRDHYDSVIEIDQKYLFDCVKHLATR